MFCSSILFYVIKNNNDNIKSEKYLYIKSRDIHILRYVATLIILNFISMTGRMDSHLARFGHMKWKLFHRYAYCRMAGKKKSVRSNQSPGSVRLTEISIVIHRG